MSAVSPSALRAIPCGHCDYRQLKIFIVTFYREGDLVINRSKLFHYCTLYFISMKILIGLILFPLISVGQITYTGSIINKTKLTKISYATVSLLKENIGIDADENGVFKLVSKNSKQGDTLIISSVGYETQKVPIDKLPSNLIFNLEENQVLLSNINLTGNKNYILRTLNDYSNCGTAYISAGEYDTQVAQHFHADTNYFLLTEVEICKYAMAIIDPDKCTFRLRLYAMDSITRKPTFELTDTVIEVTTDKRRTTINLNKYQIYISEKDFFVAIEWLKIPFNTRTEKSKINGKREKITNYSPLIAFKDYDKQKSGNAPEVWLQNYRGKWSSVTYTSKLMISAKIKYLK